MRQPNKKCIAKKCIDCQFYQSWDMTNNEGIRKSEMLCSMQILFNEIPRIRGAIDGLQGGVNESRNRSMEAKSAVEAFGNAAVRTLQEIPIKLKLLEGDK